MQGSVTNGIMVVRPYFGLGLNMTFLERDCIGGWFNGGKGEGGLVGELVGMGKGSGEGLGEGRKGARLNRPTDGEVHWNGVGGVRDEGWREDG